VFLLWPTQPLGVIEHNSGAAVAILVTVGANVILFGLVGVAVNCASGRAFVLFGIYLLLAILIYLLASWAAGSDLSQVDVLALAVALTFYALLFWLSTRGTILRKLARR
jgi:hypothetical protein